MGRYEHFSGQSKCVQFPDDPQNDASANATSSVSSSVLQGHEPLNPQKVAHLAAHVAASVAGGVGLPLGEASLLIGAKAAERAREVVAGVQPDKRAQMIEELLGSAVTIGTVYSPGWLFLVLLHDTYPGRKKILFYLQYRTTQSQTFIYTVLVLVTVVLVASHGPPGHVVHAGVTRHATRTRQCPAGGH